MGKKIQGNTEPASIKNRISDVNVGPHNLAEEMSYFFGADGHKVFRDDLTVENLMYQLTVLMRGQVVSKDILSSERLSSKQKNGLRTLYNYATTCKDVNIQKLEKYTQALLENRILTKDLLMPIHLDKIADLKSLESAVCKRKDSHFSRYSHETYNERTSGEVREKTSASKSWGIFNDSVHYNNTLTYLNDELGNINTYTNMELHAIKKSLMNIIEDAISKGHNVEACELLKILGCSKLSKKLENVKFKSEPLIKDMMLYYFDKIMWSFAKHTRNMILPDEAIDYNLKYRKTSETVSHSDIAKGDKLNAIMLFINDVFNGAYGEAFAGNMELKNKLLARYNHYLDSCHRSIKGDGNPRVIKEINGYLDEQKI